jgi:mRNA-degrading endonuclease toxin of MazEF toxin-antitoxin module
MIKSAVGPASNPRPVVIVQDDRLDVTAAVTICPLTSNPVEAPLTRIAVEPSPGPGIEQSSQIMVDKITTVARANAADRLGRRYPCVPDQHSSHSTPRCAGRRADPMSLPSATD